MQPPLLELGTYEVRDVAFGSDLRLSEGVLEFDPQALRAQLMEHGNFADVTIDIVKPGDDVRIIHFIDAVEPRVRVTDRGSDFPGMLSPPDTTVGNGRTNRLDGVVVTVVGEPVPGEPTYWREAIFDMAGETARYSVLSERINVVLTVHPDPDAFEEPSPDAVHDVYFGTSDAREYGRKARIAALRAAVYLAGASLPNEADRIDSYGLKNRGDASLPRVAYLYQIKTPYVYGEMFPGGRQLEIPVPAPTIIHPNELFDGAIVNCMNGGAAGHRDITYEFQSHPVLQELYARDGRDLEFCGVVLYTFGDSLRNKERITSYAANLAVLLGAQGAVLSYSGGGHPAVDFMMTCKKLEERDVKTVLMSPETAVNPEDSGFVHFVREADAIVSTGNYEEIIELDRVGTVIGGTTLLEGEDDPVGPLRTSLRTFVCATSPRGLSRLGGREC